MVSKRWEHQGTHTVDLYCGFEKSGNDSLKVATRLTANTKWKPEYTLPLKDGTCIPIMQVLNRNFRVKLKIQRVYYKIINDGYPKLIIQHFEIK